MPASAVAVIGRDARLVAEVRRLAALTGVEIEVVPLEQAAASWRSAGSVVLDPETAQALADTVSGRRDGVVVVGWTPAEPAGWQAALRLGATAVLELPSDEHELLEHLVGARGVSARGPAVCCVPGSGGAGASTLAVALALAAATSGGRTVLVDGDRLGGGLDVLLGAERLPGLRWPDLLDVRGTLAPAALTDSVVQVGGVHLISWDRKPPHGTLDVVHPVLAAARRAAEMLVLDLPRHFDATVGQLAAACDLALVIATGDVRSAASSCGVAAEVARWCPDVRLVVRTARGDGLRPRDVAAAVDVPLVGELATERAIAVAADAGTIVRALPRLALFRLARELLDPMRAGRAA